MRRTLAALTLAASLLWAGAILTAPRVLAEASALPAPLPAAAAVTYLAGHIVCHQRPERSFHAAGRPYPVCARCSGLYVMFPVALAVLLTACRPPRHPAASLRWWLMAAATPTAATVLGERLWGWSSAPLRAATGAILATGLAWLIYVALSPGVQGASGRSATLR